jgi:hypothetical protein
VEFEMIGTDKAETQLSVLFLPCEPVTIPDHPHPLKRALPQGCTKGLTETGG